MGQRGPKPKPNAFKLLAGNPGKRPIVSGDGARFRPGAPTCPAWLNADAKREFRRVVKELAAAGAVCEIDAELVAAYASVSADLAAVSRAIDKGGVVVDVPTFNRNGKPTGHSAQRPNPLLRTKDALTGRVKQLADALGIGHAARARQGATAEAPDVRGPNRVLDIKARIEAARQGAPLPPSGNAVVDIATRFHTAN